MALSERVSFDFCGDCVREEIEFERRDDLLEGQVVFFLIRAEKPDDFDLEVPGNVK